MKKMLSLALLLSSCGDGPAPPEKGVSPSTATPEKSKVISVGKAYSSRDYVIPGYVTILDFYADW